MQCQASWKKFLIDMMYLRGYVTLYPNFPNQTSFSTNHMEPGAHINASDNVVKHKREDFVVPLLYVSNHSTPRIHALGSICGTIVERFSKNCNTED